mmetsp:Transcript_40055/g.89881  ORF Transcript_40055/g.89881 Transcript_40055/m.89881 type:complete len:886 (+) Transcript_40055:59-2716(+)
MPAWRGVKVAAIRTDELSDATAPSSEAEQQPKLVGNERSGMFTSPFSHDAVHTHDATEEGADEDPVGALITDEQADDEGWKEAQHSRSANAGQWELAQPGIALPHLLVLAALLASDALYLQLHDSDDRDYVAGAAVLLFVYMLLWSMIWIVPVQCRLSSPVHILLWAVFYFLHGAVAVLSADFRQEVNAGFDEQCAWAAYLICFLQLLIHVLYKVDARMSVLASAALTVAVLIYSCIRFSTDVLQLLQGLLPMAAVALALCLRASCAPPSEAAVQVEELRQLLKPLLSDPRDNREIKTRHERVVKQLHRTLERIRQSHADPEIARLLSSAVSFLLVELKSPHLLSLIPDNHASMKGASPQTMQFLRHTLGQHDARPETGAKQDAASEAGTVGTSPSKGEGDEARVVVNSREQAAAGPHIGDLSPKRLLSGALAALSLDDQEAPAHETLEEAVGFLTKPFVGIAGSTPKPAPELTDDLREALNVDVGQWRFDSLKLAQLCDNRPLIVLGSRLVVPYVHDLGFEQERVDTFLRTLESRYREGMSYHNSTHAADVMNSVVYLLRLKDRHISTALEPLEKLAALTAAASHDVGHTGQANRFHVTTRTALAMLYNDQSPLENMHCALAFAILRISSADFLEPLAAVQLTTFRSIVVQMILDTDLGKHIQMVSKFRQEYLSTAMEGAPTLPQRRDILSFMLKCCDVSHSTKPFNLHLAWTLRISCEFFNQGDLESDLGLPSSPFCARHGTNIAESQRGFFDFIVSPLYNAMDEFFSNHQFQMEVLHELETNNAFWKTYTGTKFDYEDPMSNLGSMCSAFLRFLRARAEQSPAGRTSVNVGKLHARSGSLEELPPARHSDAGVPLPEACFSTRSAPMPGNADHGGGKRRMPF